MNAASIICCRWPPMTVPAGDELHEAKAERPAPVTKETTAEPA